MEDAVKGGMGNAKQNKEQETTCSTPKQDEHHAQTDGRSLEVGNTDPGCTKGTNRAGVPTRVLRMTQLECQVTEEDIHYFFSPICPVASIKLTRDKFASSPRSVAYIHFSTPEDAQCAFENLCHAEFECQKQPFKLTFAQEKNKHQVHQPTKHTNATAATTVLTEHDGHNAAEECSGKEEGEVDSKTNYVLDESTGLLYDTVSGYYFDSATGLYGDPVSSQWFSYDHATGLYSLYTPQPEYETSHMEGDAHKNAWEQNTDTTRCVDAVHDDKNQRKKGTNPHKTDSIEKDVCLKPITTKIHVPSGGGSSVSRKRKYRDRAAERRAAVGSEAPS